MTHDIYLSMTHNRPEMSVLFLINSQQTRGVCNISLNDSQQTTGVCPISHQLTADQICLFHFASTLNEPEMSVLFLITSFSSTFNRSEMSVLFFINSQQTRCVCPIFQPLSTDQRYVSHFSSTLNTPEMSVLSLSLNNSPDKLSRPEMAILFSDDPQETGDVYLTVVTGICVHSNSISKCYFVPTLHTCLFCPPCWE